MRRRPSSRLLVVDPAGLVLLFRFSHRDGALAGQSFWATPGGGLEDGESFEQAAVRELREETGIAVDRVDLPVAERLFEMTMPDGERVLAEERLYLVRTDDAALSKDGWTELEHAVMAEHRWWSVADLEATAETVYPDDLAEILRRAA
jgi:8-oxo-dGTP pyrophosphatase MutT (NUDIX family)